MTEDNKIKLEGKYFEATGRRKTATARIRIYLDKKARIIINDRDYKQFLSTANLVALVESPLKATGYDNATVSAHVIGGGIRGQAEAIRHGISRALLKIDAELRSTLKPLGFVTRDPRAKERKKPGLKKARKAPQWAKR